MLERVLPGGVRGKVTAQPFGAKSLSTANVEKQRALTSSQAKPPGELAADRDVRAPLGPHFTVSGRLWLWLLNSGAYMHWIWATPVWYWPRSWMRVEYSKT